MNLWALLPAAVSLGITAINQSRKSDYAANTKYLEKYISSLRGRQNENQTYRQMMEPGLRQVGAQTQQARYGMEYDLNRMGMGNSGAAVAGNLALNRQALDQTSQMHSQAAMAQAAENRASGDRIIEAEAQVGQAKEAANQQYAQAKRQWQNQMWGGALGLAAQGVAGHMQQVGADKKLIEGATGEMPVTDPSLGKGSGQALTRREAIQHFGSVANYVRALQKQHGLESANYYQDVMTGKVAPDDIDINKLGPEYYNAYVHSQIGEHKKETAGWESLVATYGQEAVDNLDAKDKASPIVAEQKLKQQKESQSITQGTQYAAILSDIESNFKDGKFSHSRNYGTPEEPKKLLDNWLSEIKHSYNNGNINADQAFDLIKKVHEYDSKTPDKMTEKSSEKWRVEYNKAIVAEPENHDKHKKLLLTQIEKPVSLKDQTDAVKLYFDVMDKEKAAKSAKAEANNPAADYQANLEGGAKLLNSLSTARQRLSDASQSTEEIDVLTRKVTTAMTYGLSYGQIEEALNKALEDPQLVRYVEAIQSGNGAVEKQIATAIAADKQWLLDIIREIYKDPTEATGRK
jgi:hypothetical protein